MASSDALHLQNKRAATNRGISRFHDARLEMGLGEKSAKRKRILVHCVDCNGHGLKKKKSNGLERPGDKIIKMTSPVAAD